MSPNDDRDPNRHPGETDDRDLSGHERGTDDDRMPLDAAQIGSLTSVTHRGGLVVFPAETVYGLATDPDDADAVRRMADLKQRDPGKPSSVLFWALDDALAAIEGAPDAVLRAVSRLLPGPIGLLVPNPQRRFAPSCGDDPTSLGIRVPLLSAGSRERWGADRSSSRRAETGGSSSPPVQISDSVLPVAQISDSVPPIVQTSANLAGGPDPTTLAGVPDAIRAGAALILDGGERPGTPSTIVDLRGVSDTTPDGWRVVREGPVAAAAISAALSGV